jgi:hypothetical protein
MENGIHGPWREFLKGRRKPPNGDPTMAQKRADGGAAWLN